ncbi:hypothetical protein [Saccharobesus litoralis]|nr:hypothetical protein [Saccharobesus litoralis]
MPPALLQKRLSSLSFYVKRAAESIISLSSPISLDSQNGAWSASQKRKIPTEKVDPEANFKWFSRYSDIGLIVPIQITQQGLTHIKLDCIDEIDTVNQCFHVNELGWFNFYGQTLQDDLIKHKTAFKSAKDIMIAACCGHQWIGSDRTYHRTLSLRELLLTSVINWQQLNKPLPITKTS